MLVGPHADIKGNKTGFKTIKERGTPFPGDPIRNTSARGRKLWRTSVSGTTRKPAVEVSAKIKEEPVVKNLPEAI
jgi:hypothetical protein